MATGGYKDEESNFEGAKGGVSEEEIAMIDTLKALGIKPKIRSPWNMIIIARILNGAEEKEE